eukprot:8891567-Pyramimonas_sp.AAC.1
MLSVFFTQLALRGGYSACCHMNRFKEIMRVRLSNPELGTRSAARTRSATIVLFESFREMLSVFCTDLGL